MPNVVYPKKYIPRYTKEERALRKQERALRKQEREFNKEKNRLRKRELNILKFMLKTDVLYHHHGEKESLIEKIKQQIEAIKAGFGYKEYDPYIWNYQGWGENYMWRSLLGCLWRSVDGFDDIHDVPLDGTYKFYVYDSGERGSGSFNRISAIKIENEIKIPEVNPGGFPPVIAN